MKVCIDGIAFENSHQRGVQRYHRELIERYPSNVEAEVLLGESPRCTMPAGGKVTFVTPSLLRALPRKWRKTLSRRVSESQRSRRERAADLFHSSYFTLPRSETPTVITVYDMIVERYTEFAGSRWAEEEVRRKRRAILGADLLIAISRATADEVAAFYPETAGRLQAIHLGADHLPEADLGAAPAGSFALFVGDRGGYKNFRVLLEAMGRAAWPKTLSLKVVGSEPNESERLMAARVGGRVEFVGRVDEASLGRIYRDSAMTIVPSLVEGFGFPIVEAQRAGSPVVCSEIAVFREIAGDSAAYFSASDPGHLAEAAAWTLESRHRNQLRESGRENARRFTWARCVEQTVQAYSRAIEMAKFNPRPSRVRA